MRFAHPELLWLLLLVPLIALLRGQAGPAPALLFSTTAVAASLGRTQKVHPGTLFTSLKLLAISCLILALARPQLGNTTTEVAASGIDIMLAVDISGSMEAMDFRLDNTQPVSRLSVVKSVVKQFIADRPNDRIGLLAFAGRPYLISPLTLDHDWLNNRLDSLKISMVEDGTAIGSAIASSLKRLNNDQNSVSKILILLTDGISNTGKIPPLVAAEAAQSLQIKVYTIGAGTKGRAATPVTDQFGRRRLVNARVDIDEKTLATISDVTGAQYFRATDTASLHGIYQQINTLETTTRTSKQFAHYRELFALFIGAFLLLTLVTLVGKTKHVP